MNTCFCRVSQRAAAILAFVIFLSCLCSDSNTAELERLEGPQFDELVTFLDSFDPAKIERLNTLMNHAPDEALRAAAEMYADMGELLRLKEKNPEAFWRTVRLSQLEYRAAQLAGKYHRAEYDYQRNRLREDLRAVLTETIDIEAAGRGDAARGGDKEQLLDTWLEGLLEKPIEEPGNVGDKAPDFEVLAEEWGSGPTDADNFLYRAGMMIEHIDILKQMEDFESADADQFLRLINRTYDQGNQGKARELLDKLYAYIWQTTMVQQKGQGKRSFRVLGKPSILMVDGCPRDKNDSVCAANYWMKLDQMGYSVGVCRWSDMTWELLEQFNVVVLMWHPGRREAPGDDAEEYLDTVYRPAFPLLLRFMEAGGGLFVIGGGAHDYESSVNELLEPFNAKILPEMVAGRAVQYKQRDHLLLDFTETSNIVRHPVTSGVPEIWYCIDESRPNLGLRTLQLDPTWTVIIKGSESSYSRAEGGTIGMFSTAPSLMACRPYKQGRIVLFGAHPSFWITDPYHLFWDRVIIERGNGFRLLTNVYNWLGKPSLQAGSLGGFGRAAPPVKDRVDHAGDIYHQLKLAGFRKPVELGTHKPVKLNTFKGIIGVHSSYSKGIGTVAECVGEAKRQGYDFIVFTEDSAAMNEGTWNKLTVECRELSDENFLALPGLGYNDIKTGNSHILFGIEDWPSHECFDGTGNGNPQAIARNCGNPPNYLMTPTTNPVKPWYVKGFNGIEIAAYNRGSRIIDRAFEEYRYLQGNTYDLVPVVSHRIFDPREMGQIDDYQVFAACESLASVPAVLRSREPGTPDTVYVSNGPRIHEWMIENARDAHREEMWRVSLDVSSEQPLRDVTIYDQNTVYRVLRPSGNRFSYRLLGHHERQHAFTMVVRDAAGKTAYSTCLSTSDIRQTLGLDRYRNTTFVNRPMIDRNGRVIMLPAGLEVAPGGEKAGGGIITPWPEVVPRGVNVQPGGFDIHFSHRIFTPAGKQETAIGRRNIVFASGDASILDNYMEMADTATPTTVADTRVRLTIFNPRPYSYSMVLVEYEVTIKKDFTFGNTRGPDLVLLRLLDKKRWDRSFRICTFIDEHGIKKTKKREAVLRGVIKLGGYVSVGPDMCGAAGIFPLTGGSHDFTIDKRGLSMGQEMGGWPVKAGLVVRDRYLVVRGLPLEQDTGGFDMIRSAYGFDGEPAYEITLSHGRVDTTLGVPVLAARDAYIEGDISQASLPNELPLCVTGLNPHWDAGMLDKETGEIRRVGVCQENDTGYLTLDVSRRRSFIVGSLLTCDNEAVHLSVLSHDATGVEMEAHNPAEKPVRIRVQSPIFKDLDEALDLAGGESKRIKNATAPR